MSSTTFFKRFLSDETEGQFRDIDRSDSCDICSGCNADHSRRVVLLKYDSLNGVLKMNLQQMRRNQLLIAALSSLLIASLWWIGDLPEVMYYVLPLVIFSLWIPAIMAHKQREGSSAWNVFFIVLGITVITAIVRTVWLIGRD